MTLPSGDAPHPPAGPTLPPVLILGSGRAGSALARLLTARSVALHGVWNRTPSKATRLAEELGLRGWGPSMPSLDEIGDSILLVAVADGAIGGVAREAAEAGPVGDGTVALHLSGALPASALAPIAQAGGSVGSFHPIQTLPADDQAWHALEHAWFGVEGEPAAVEAAMALARAVGRPVLDVPTAGKPLYHAAGVAAANFVVALAALAGRLLAASGARTGGDPGVEQGQNPLKPLLPLMRAALENTDRLGPTRALTGPVARGDVDTVSFHLQAFAEVSPSPEHAYRALSRELLGLVDQMAPEQQPEQARIEMMRRLLDETGERTE